MTRLGCGLLTLGALACGGSSTTAPDTVEGARPDGERVSAEPPATVPSGTVTSAPVASATGAASGASAAEEGDGARRLSEFQRGALALPGTGADTLLVVQPEKTCTALPKDAPAGATVTVTFRGGEPESRVMVQLAREAPCRFHWPALHIRRPPMMCVVLTEEEGGKLWSLLRAQRFNNIREVKLTSVSPHRGGLSVEVRWSGGACSVTDGLDTDVHAQDRARWDVVRSAALAFVDGAARPSTP